MRNKGSLEKCQIMWRLILRACPLALALFLAGAITAHAQTATIKGHVTDQQTAVIPGATVEVASEDGATKEAATSDAEGAKSIAELRSGLGANYVLEGSVRRALDQLRIDVVLISTKDGSQVWSKSYTGEARDILRLQDNVTTDVATQIGATLPGSATRRDLFPFGQQVDPKAYEAYLEGRVHWLNRDLLRSRESY